MKQRKRTTRQKAETFELSTDQLRELMHIAADLRHASPAGAEADAAKIDNLIRQVTHNGEAGRSRAAQNPH